MSDFSAEEAKAEQEITVEPQPEVVVEKKTEKKAAKKAPAGKSYKRGDAGNNIRLIQQYLNSNGFPCPETGVFCIHTHGAVKKFQNSLGIAEDGVITEDMISIAK